MCVKLGLNRRFLAAIFLTASAGVLCAKNQAAILRVPSEYPTIQAGIDASVDGDTVLVASGVYRGDGNRDIDFMGKAITLKSEAGPETCIIECGGRYPEFGTPRWVEAEYHRGFFFHSHEDTNSVVQGFTITQGYLFHESGGAILCEESSPTIKNCIISKNVARSGGGISAYRSDMLIVSCIIARNIASLAPLEKFYGPATLSRGGGVEVLSGNTKIMNSLIVGNVASYGAGIRCSQGNHHINNCTVIGNQTAKQGKGGGIFGETGRINLANSIIWGNVAHYDGNDIYMGLGGILGPMRLHIANSLVGKDPNDMYDRHDLVTGDWRMGDPMFAGYGYWDPNGTEDNPDDDYWVDGDYHLQSQAGRWDPVTETWVRDEVTSPCIDTGDPMSPIGLEPFPNGGIVNMGAYGGTVEASKSYFNTEPCETVMAGDINGDCKVDFLDLQILSSHWLCDGN